MRRCVLYIVTRASVRVLRGWSGWNVKGCDDLLPATRLVNLWIVFPQSNEIIKTCLEWYMRYFRLQLIMNRCK